jgi:hypothetical protein
MKEKESGSKKIRLQIEPRDASIQLFKLPLKIEDINTLGLQMLEWCYMNNKEVDLSAFPIRLRVSPYQFYRLANKSEQFANCLELCRAIIAQRLLKAWKDGSMPSEYVRFELTRYDEGFFKKVMELRVAQQQAMNQGIMNFKTVEVPAIPDSSKVRKLER